MANNRIYYAIQAVKVKPCRTTDGGTSYQYGSEYLLRGIQSVGMTSNFNLEQVYQLGQVELYDQVEEVPNIEVTMTKVLDGTRLTYNLCNDGNTANSSNGLNLSEVTDRRCDLALGIWSDTLSITSGGADYYVVCTGMYVSNISYKFATDGNLTEDITLVGNHKKWGLNSGGGITSFNSGIGANAEGRKVARRWALDKASSVLPSGNGGVPGTFGSGLHVNSMTLTCQLGREAINELGRRSPYYRYIKFPVEVTSEIEVTATLGDNIDADDFELLTGCSATASGNLVDKSIKVVVCNPSGTGAGTKYTVDLGDKNKLTSVNFAGGDTGGGNATATYSFQTFNFFKVTSPNA